MNFDVFVLNERRMSEDDYSNIVKLSKLKNYRDVVNSWTTFFVDDIFHKLDRMNAFGRKLFYIKDPLSDYEDHSNLDVKTKKEKICEYLDLIKRIRDEELPIEWSRYLNSFGITSYKLTA